MVTETYSKTEIIEGLRRTQADVICLYLNAKRYHWYTFGPLFRDLHLLFDEIALIARDQIDPFGERVRILGGDPVSSPDEIKATSQVVPSNKRDSVMDMLNEALHNERQVIESMRDGARQADRGNDPGTVDLYSRGIVEHEKYAWFLEETLRRGEGIIT